jgi:glucose-1-phosphate adenylyltransferase
MPDRAVSRAPSPWPATAMAYVLAGGRGSRLMELTDKRAKPAVYFGGKSRIIDFALSNAINSGIRRIGGRDAVQGAQPDPPPAARLELPAPRAQRELRHPAGEPARVRVPWYEGTADAVFQNIDIIAELRPSTS